MAQQSGDGIPARNQPCTRHLDLLDPSAALYARIAGQFDSVLTLTDLDRHVGGGQGSTSQQPGSATQPSSLPVRSVAGKRQVRRHRTDQSRAEVQVQERAVAIHPVSDGYFAKVDLYANSRLPMHLPPLKLYMPTYPLLCLAAEYSERVYEDPRGAERDAFIRAGLRSGTKAMVVKSVPMDHMNVVVFAIRGTASFMDWAVNLNTSPAPPADFLDDPGNLCHAGFLSVARRTVAPVAHRLRQLLSEDPSRTSHSLLLTGHSAGGAVAALLYAHMQARSVQSELGALAGLFRRVHCITFGAPPISLLPLEGRGHGGKSLFLSFVNEGDPVARADKAYLRSLFALFATPAPAPAEAMRNGDKEPEASLASLRAVVKRESPARSESGRDDDTAPEGAMSTAAMSTGAMSTGARSTRARKHLPSWAIPPCTLSSAGRIVVLRSGDPQARLDGKRSVEERLDEGVVAQIATDERLRQVVWGDPVCHVMKLYAGRIETLAVGAVTARGY